MDKLYSDEQIARAKEIELEYYLRLKGETLKRAGREYKWIYRDGTGTHDSVTVKGNKWFDHKNQQGGDTIGFLQEFMGYSFRDAIEELLGGEQGSVETAKGSNSRKPPLPRNHLPVYEPVSESGRKFILPEPAENMRKLFAYLIKSRHISAEVIQHFVHAKSIYQEKERGNIVFVGKDEYGEARSGTKKSVNTFVKDAFKGTIAGSNTDYGFGHKGGGDKLFVFEAPVDLMSYITIFPDKWREQSYIALDGLSSRAMFHFLDNNPQIDKINICIDHDEAGIEAYDKFRDMLLDKGYTSENIVRVMPVHKDWNEMLKAGAGEAYKPAQKHPCIESFRENVERLCNVCGQRGGSYINWRSEQYAKNGAVSVFAAIANEYEKFTASIEQGKIAVVKSGNANENLLRMADLCFMTVSELASAELKCPNKAALYKNKAIQMAAMYKPYTDKGKLKSRCAGLEQSFDTLKKAIYAIADNEQPTRSLLDFAKACLQTKVYLDTKYETDLIRQQALADKLDSIKPKASQEDEIALSL